jgi:hypothetical protein
MENQVLSCQSQIPDKTEKKIMKIDKMSEQQTKFQKKKKLKFLRIFI